MAVNARKETAKEASDKVGIRNNLTEVSLGQKSNARHKAKEWKTYRRRIRYSNRS